MIERNSPVSRPIYELHQALRDLLAFAEILAAETGRNDRVPGGAISNARTALQIHEAAANFDFHKEATLRVD
jgi:hypothetical protein